MRRRVVRAGSGKTAPFSAITISGTRRSRRAAAASRSVSAARRDPVPASVIGAVGAAVGRAASPCTTSHGHGASPGAAAYDAAARSS